MAVGEPVLSMDTTETADASPHSASAASRVSTFSSTATGEDVSCASLLQSSRSDAPPPTPRTKRFQLKLGTDFLSSKKKTTPQPLHTSLSLSKAANKFGFVAAETTVDKLEVAHKNQDKAPISSQLQSPKLNIVLPDETTNVKNSVFKLRLPSEFKSPKPQAVAAIVPDEQVLMDMENSQISEKFLPGGNSYKKINKVGHRDTTFISKSIIHEPSINTATVESLTLNRSEIEMSIPGSSLNETEVGRSKTETTPGLTRSVKESVPKARAMSLNSRVGTINALKLSKPSKIPGNDSPNGASHSLPGLASADLKKDENLRNNDESCSTKGAVTPIAKFPIRFTDLKFSKPTGPVGEICSVSNNDKVLHLDQEVNEDETEKKALEVNNSLIDPEPMKTVERPKDVTSKCDSSVQGVLNVEKDNSEVGPSARKTAPFSNIPSISNIPHRHVQNVLPPAEPVQSQFSLLGRQAEQKGMESLAQAQASSTNAQDHYFGGPDITGHVDESPGALEERRHQIEANLDKEENRLVTELNSSKSSMLGAAPDSPFSLNLGQSAFSDGEEQERAAGFDFFNVNGGESRGDFSLFGQADTEGDGLEENNFSFSLNGGNFVSAFDTNSDKLFF